MRAPILLLLFCFSASSVLAAHITDRLVVGLYAEPTTEGKPVELLTSGAALEVLSRREGFAEVEVASGNRGWVEDRYVTDDKPAKAELKETQARLRQQGLELAALRSEKLGDAPANAPTPLTPTTEEARLRQALLEAEARAEDFEARLAEGMESIAEEATRERIRMAIDVLSEVPGVNRGPATPGPLSDWGPWIIGLAALVLGFVGGVAYVDYKIRRRYGRFRF